LLAALLQATCLAAWSIRTEWADLVLVTVILITLQGGTRQGLVAGVTGGLAMGFGSGQALTAFLVSYAVMAAVIARLRQAWQIESPLIQIAVVLGATLGQAVVFGLLYPSLFSRPDLWDALLLRAGLNAAVTMPLSWLLSWLPIPKASVME
jgi:rod shape-determining protein MreD